jgi:hypothetical protein
MLRLLRGSKKLCSRGASFTVCQGVASVLPANLDSQLTATNLVPSEGSKVPNQPLSMNFECCAQINLQCVLSGSIAVDEVKLMNHSCVAQ